jgi:hypothetical protein
MLSKVPYAGAHEWSLPAAQHGVLRVVLVADDAAQGVRCGGVAML